MLSFSCCSRNNGVIKEEYTALDGVCLGKTDIRRNEKEKENKCRNRRKKYRF